MENRSATVGLFCFPNLSVALKTRSGLQICLVVTDELMQGRLYKRTDDLRLVLIECLWIRRICVNQQASKTAYNPLLNAYHNYTHSRREEPDISCSMQFKDTVPLVHDLVPG